MTASYAPSPGNFIEAHRDDTSHCPGPLITVRIYMFVFVVRYVPRHSVNVSFVLLSTFLALCPIRIDGVTRNQATYTLIH